MKKILQAASLLQDGSVVAFPTETVYGLGADATNEQACQKIFRLKNRPNFNPLIVHVADLEAVNSIEYLNDDALLLARHIWHGPLTLVLPHKKTSAIAPCVTAGLDTIAIRIPAGKTALELIKAAGRPIAAPSANISGKLSPTKAEHVIKDYGDKIFVLEEKEKSKYGLESTVIDLSGKAPRLLRYGFIAPELISSILQKDLVAVTEPGGEAPVAPGMLLKHYAPVTPLRINATGLLPGEVGLNFGPEILKGQNCLNLSPEGDLGIAATNLFEYLHLLDNYSVANSIFSIAVAPVPDVSIGLAINDRLRRAAAAREGK